MTQFIKLITALTIYAIILIIVFVFVSFKNNLKTKYIVVKIIAILYKTCIPPTIIVNINKHNPIIEITIFLS